AACQGFPLYERSGIGLGGAPILCRSAPHQVTTQLDFRYWTHSRPWAAALPRKPALQSTTGIRPVETPAARPANRQRNGGSEARCERASSTLSRPSRPARRTEGKRTKAVFA